MRTDYPLELFYGMLVMLPAIMNLEQMLNYGGHFLLVMIVLLQIPQKMVGLNIEYQLFRTEMANQVTVLALQTGALQLVSV